MKKSISICASSLQENYAGFKNLSAGDLILGLAAVAQDHSTRNLLKDANENPIQFDPEEMHREFGDVLDLERQLRMREERKLRREGYLLRKQRRRHSDRDSDLMATAADDDNDSGNRLRQQQQDNKDSRESILNGQCVDDALASLDDARHVTTQMDTVKLSFHLEPHPHGINDHYIRVHLTLNGEIRGEVSGGTEVGHQLGRHGNDTITDTMDIKMDDDEECLIRAEDDTEGIISSSSQHETGFRDAPNSPKEKMNTETTAASIAAEDSIHSTDDNTPVASIPTGRHSSALARRVAPPAPLQPQTSPSKFSQLYSPHSIQAPTSPSTPTLPSATTSKKQQLSQASSTISRFNPDNVSPFLLKTCMEILDTAFLPYNEEKMKRQKNILALETVAKHHEPVHIAYLDHREERIVISVRGTSSIQDVFTDLSANVIDFETSRYYLKPNSSFHKRLLQKKVSGKCHHGMCVAARWLLRKLTPQLKATFRKHANYSILTCGHSLGGSTAAVLALLLREWCMQPEVCNDLFAYAPLPEIKCISFACPAVFSRELSLFCRPFITTFCVGTDIVTRLSSGQAEALRQEILNSRWKTKVGKWYTEWNENQKPFEKINGFLGRWNLPKIPTQLEWAHSPQAEAGSDIDQSKILTLYPCGAIHLLTYLDKQPAPPSKTRIITAGRPFVIRHVSYRHFDRIILTSSMFHDHRISNYFEAFEYLTKIVHYYELQNNIHHTEELNLNEMEILEARFSENEYAREDKSTDNTDDGKNPDSTPNPTQFAKRHKLEIRKLQEKLKAMPHGPSQYKYTTAQIVR